MKAPFDVPKRVGEWLKFGEHVLLHVKFIRKLILNRDFMIKTKQRYIL
jgi:hypothetical protein